MQEGRRKPYSLSVRLAAEVAFIHAPICGTVTWLSSVKMMRVVGDVFEHGRRRLAGFAAGEVAGIILDAGARAGGQHHLHVEFDALFEALGFEQFALGVELGEARFRVLL